MTRVAVHKGLEQIKVDIEIHKLAQISICIAWLRLGRNNVFFTFPRY